jgi:hypothetical protein
MQVAHTIRLPFSERKDWRFPLMLAKSGADLSKRIVTLRRSRTRPRLTRGAAAAQLMEAATAGGAAGGMVVANDCHSRRIEALLACLERYEAFGVSGAAFPEKIGAFQSSFSEMLAVLSKRSRTASSKLLRSTG